MSTRPAKRRRTKNASKAPRMTRSDELWHSDGNVVLQAEQTQWKVEWKVLALYSSYFRDMQAQPHPPKPSDIDGCPVIELSDDAQDVEDVLKALYIPAFHCEPKLPLPVVRAFIRLGRKYDFKDLLKSAVTRIMSEAPTTLEEYDALNGRIEFKSFEDFNGLELDLITLASENNLLAALPCLYYRAVQLWGPRTEHLSLCLGSICADASKVAKDF
ncbi:BTB domain-containing protein [Mycena sanguinolenta]|uniref:BTB domain-containing protein n=1 Tax=Mycena sanguinolenta TaxID=230812 RepID=A0A8H7CWP3_9AGAR|nr:BTB domain-containing protein [Mycena sanguinolenta]